MTVLARLLAKFEVDEATGCWLWTDHLTNGYGRLKVDGRFQAAHRVSYELFIGPIPDGLTLDHTCHTDSECAGGVDCPHRRCVNPAHLEPVTGRENTLRGEGPTAINARKETCDRGHSLEDAYRYPDGRRQCRECRRDYIREYMRARRAA